MRYTKLDMTVRMLERIRRVYRRLPKYIAVVVVGGSAICVGGSSDLVNMKRELSKIQDAFGGSTINKFDIKSAKIEIRQTGKDGKVLAVVSMSELMRGII